MAIFTITGKPRSGKSYWIVYKLYYLFLAILPKRSSLFAFFYKYLNKFISKKNRKKFIFILRSLFENKKKVFYFAYVNVKGFDFSKTSRIKPLNFKQLYFHLEYLHAMYLSEKTDYELIEYAKSYNLYKAIFVIDECQDYFEKKDKVLMWWFSYHGHLYHDIYILTQNLGLIYEEYFKFSEFYYRAVPPSNRLFSSQFRYMQFNSYKLFKTERIASFNVPVVQDVYDMYESGDNNYSPSFVKKYFIYALLLFVFLFASFVFFISQFSTTKATNDKNISTPVETVPTHKQPEPKKQAIINADINDTKLMLFDIKCVDMLCNYNDVDFPKPLLNKIIKKTPPEFQWFFANGAYIQYFVMLPNNTFDFLPEPKQKDKKDAKSTPNEKTTSHNPIAKLVSK